MAGRAGGSRQGLEDVKTYVHIARGCLRVILRFPLRSTVILLSTMLGVAGVIISMSYATAGRGRVLQQLRELGTNVMTVTPAPSRSVGGRARTGAAVTTLADDDYLAIRHYVADIVRASATSSGSFLAKVGDLSKNNCVVIGVEPDYFGIKDWTPAAGRLLEEADVRGAARVAILGATVRTDLFDGSPIGQRLFINRVPFVVIGVMTERGQGLDASNEDAAVYVPVSTARHRLMNVSYFSSLVFEIGQRERMGQAAAEIRDVLERRHRTALKGPDDFQIQNQKTLIDTEVAAATQFRFLVRSVGVSGLIVSGLGVLAISWLAVKARVTEIGTRRALGATAPDVFVQFVTETVITGVAGGLVGVAGGVIGARAVAARLSAPLAFDWTIAGVAFGLAAGLNLIVSLVPAVKAACVHPMQALKHE